MSASNRSPFARWEDANLFLVGEPSLDQKPLVLGMIDYVAPNVDARCTIYKLNCIEVRASSAALDRLLDGTSLDELNTGPAFVEFVNDDEGESDHFALRLKLNPNDQGSWTEYYLPHFHFNNAEPGWEKQHLAEQLHAYHDWKRLATE